MNIIGNAVTDLFLQMSKEGQLKTIQIISKSIEELNDSNEFLKLELERIQHWSYSQTEETRAAGDSLTHAMVLIQSLSRQVSDLQTEVRFNKEQIHALAQPKPSIWGRLFKSTKEL